MKRPAQPAPLKLTLVDNARHAGLPSASTLRRWVRLALDREAQLALVFCGAAAGRRLNREFRGRDYATNVLTFSYQLRPQAMADIVLCVPVVRREAREQGKPFRDHLAHLVFHGVLHALGHDHQRAGDAARMQRLERDFLARLRIPDPYASESGA